MRALFMAAIWLASISACRMPMPASAETGNTATGRALADVTAAGKPQRPGAIGEALPAIADLPSWLQTKIAEIQAEPMTNPATRLFRFQIEGKTYYLRPTRCCDIMSELYDAEGNRICQPSGGITGRGDGRCDWFLPHAGEGRLIWKDKRERRMEKNLPTPAPMPKPVTEPAK